MADESKIVGDRVDALEEIKELQQQGDWLIIEDDDGGTKKMQANILCYQLVDVICGGSVGTRRKVKRGRDLTELFTINELHNKMQNGDFSNIFIDDYIPIDITTSLGGSEHVQLDVADMDYFYNCGDEALLNHHLVLVPHDQFLAAASMNSSNTTENGYTSCALRTNVLPVYYSAVNAQLENHILTHRRYLTTVVNTSATSAGGANLSGSATTAAWTDATMELLSEPMVYDGAVFSSSGRDVGDACMQFAKFALCPEERVSCAGHNSGTRRTWWLCAVASSADFCYCTYSGNVSYGNASSEYGVRPYLLFG